MSVKLPLSEHSTAIGSIETAYWETVSTHQPLILLHGLSGSHHGLMPLAEHLTDYHLFLPDLPGHGRTQIPVHHDIATVVAWFIDFVRFVRHRTGQVPIIVAHSLGAQIAFEACQKLGDNYQVCIILNPVPGVDTLPRLLQQALAVVPQPIAYGIAGHPAARKWRGAYLQVRRDPATKARVAWVAKNSATQPARFAYYVSLSSKLSGQCGFTAEAVARGRYMCIIADRDSMLSKSAIQLLQTMFGKEAMATCTGTGHLMPIELPLQTAHLVRTMISRSRDSASAPRPASAGTSPTAHA